MLDLDKENVKNFNEEEKLDNKQYLSTMILEYKLPTVANKPLVKIYVRGISRMMKDFDTNVKVIFFALHESSLIIWTMLDETGNSYSALNFV